MYIAGAVLLIHHREEPDSHNKGVIAQQLWEQCAAHVGQPSCKRIEMQQCGTS